MEINKVMNIQIEKLKNIEYNMHFFVYAFVAFFVPFMMGHPQLLVGVVVNSALILSAVFLDAKASWPIIILPSLGVLSRGVIFGPFSVYLVYMIPFIWVGNFLIVYLVKYFYLKRRKNYALSLGVGAVVKSAFLFTAAFVLVKLGIIPVLFLTAMGVLQLATALGGGVVSYGVVRARNLVVSKRKPYI